MDPDGADGWDALAGESAVLPPVMVSPLPVVDVSPEPNGLVDAELAQPASNPSASTDQIDASGHRALVRR